MLPSEEAFSGSSDAVAALSRMGSLCMKHLKSKPRRWKNGEKLLSTAHAE